VVVKFVLSYLSMSFTEDGPKESIGDNSPITVSIGIAGRVQGVWFRASAKKEADRLAIVGFVKNLPNGGVYIEATGSPKAMKIFVHWCNQGPELAHVDSVHIHPITPSHLQNFEVRRT
jgi:acylphosphatase